FSTHHLFQHPPTTQISTLSLHDALPIWHVTQSFRREIHSVLHSFCAPSLGLNSDIMAPMKSRHIVLVLLFLLSMITYVDRVCISDRKSTRLNSSHQIISYAVFCLKKKQK